MLIIAFIASVFLSTTVHAQDNDPNAGIIPAPVSLIKSPGEFTFSRLTVIRADKPKDNAVELLKGFLGDNVHLNNRIIKYNYRTKVPGNTLILTAHGAETLPNEGYKLTITPRKITIVGKGAGLFYGIQTLIQLFPVNAELSAKLPCLVISDEPRFGYRGMMLDVSRHFFKVPEIKKVLDLMAEYKLNNFH